MEEAAEVAGREGEDRRGFGRPDRAGHRQQIVVDDGTGEVVLDEEVPEREAHGGRYQRFGLAIEPQYVESIRGRRTQQVAAGVGLFSELPL